MSRAASNRPQRKSRTADLCRAAVVALGAFASLATPAPRYPRNYPAWELLNGQAKVHGCADAVAWVSKSGKSGVGLTVEIRTRGACRVSVPRAALILADGTEVAGRVEEPTDEAGNANGRFIYVAFLFDNNRAWNRGIRTGRFDFDLTVDDRAERWSMDAEHRLDGFHRDLAEPRPRKRWRAR
jgi:hypothetical protein